MTTPQIWRLHIMRSNLRRKEHIKLQRRRINASGSVFKRKKGERKKKGKGG
jgi:hypothetical protein